MKIEDELFHKIIMGFHIIAMLDAKFSKTEAKRSWNALKIVLEDCEVEQAIDIYDLLMGNNPELEEYMKEMLGKA